MVLKIDKTIQLFIILLSFVTNVFASDSGVCSGKIQLDDSWESLVYLSVIDDFEEMNKMSYQMIVTQDSLDENGNFSLNIGCLPAEDCLIRLHVVKKGTSPASLIVGGEEDNNVFLIANKKSNIQIYTMGEKPVFKDMVILNSPESKVFNYLTELKNYPNAIDYMTTLLDKHFVEEVVDEKLKYFADTCNNVLLALYALNLVFSPEDYLNDTHFYQTILHRLEDENSLYYLSFVNQLPKQRKRGTIVFLVLIFVLIGGVSYYLFIIKKQHSKLDKLSVQERKIFDLIKQGASNQQIADEFHIEVSTVKSHVNSIFSKLQVKSRKEIMNMK